MDYADYLNNQIQEQYELADDMERAGCDTYEEFLDYLDDLAEIAADRQFEEQRLQDDI